MCALARTRTHTRTHALHLPCSWRHLEVLSATLDFKNMSQALSMHYLPRLHGIGVARSSECAACSSKMPKTSRDFPEHAAKVTDNNISLLWQRSPRAHDRLCTNHGFTILKTAHSCELSENIQLVLLLFSTAQAKATGKDIFQRVCEF